MILVFTTCSYDCQQKIVIQQSLFYFIMMGIHEIFIKEFFLVLWGQLHTRDNNTLGMCQQY